jgi:hypothetical protein
MRLINVLLASGVAWNIIINTVRPQKAYNVMSITQTTTSVATTVLCSALIVIRIYKMSIPSDPTYSTITTMIIEPASLYSVAAVLWMALEFSDRAFEGALYIESFFTAMVVSPQKTFHIHGIDTINRSVFRQL